MIATSTLIKARRDRKLSDIQPGIWQSRASVSGSGLVAKEPKYSRPKEAQQLSWSQPRKIRLAECDFEVERIVLLSREGLTLDFSRPSPFSPATRRTAEIPRKTC